MFVQALGGLDPCRNGRKRCRKHGLNSYRHTHTHARTHARTDDTNNINIHFSHPGADFFPRGHFRTYYILGAFRRVRRRAPHHYFLFFAPSSSCGACPHFLSREGFGYPLPLSAAVLTSNYLHSTHELFSFSRFYLANPPFFSPHEDSLEVTTLRGKNGSEVTHCLDHRGSRPLVWSVESQCLMLSKNQHRCCVFPLRLCVHLEQTGRDEPVSVVCNADCRWLD